MFYLYDLATYSKNYGSLSTGEEEEHEDLLRQPSSYWSDDEDSWNGRPRQRRRQRKDEQLLNIDEAVQSLGMGIFQYRIGLAAGMLLAADSMEAVILSFLSNIFVKHHQVNLEDAELNYSGTMNMVVFPAGVVGALVWGMLGDMFGRRVVFNGAAATIAIFGVGTAFVSSYGWLLATRLLVGFGIGGLTVPFCTFSEFLPPSQRGPNLVCVQFFCIVGALFVHLTLQQQHPNVQAWRQIVVVCSIPSILATILGLTVVPESPRWLLARNRQEEALAILRVAAKTNGKDPTILFPAGTILYSHEPQETKNALFSLFSPGWIKLTSVLWSTYFGMSFLDHGTISLAVSVFSSDSRQQNYQGIFNASSQFLSLFLVVFLIDGFGRSSTQCAAYALGGILCLAISLMEDFNSQSNPNIVLVLTFLAHTCIFGGKCATWVSTTEILATEMRTTGHGMANVFSRLGGFLSSYVLSRISSLPSIGLSLFVVSLWTASSASKLPETNVKEMGVVYYPQTSSSTTTSRRRRRAAACSSSQQNIR
jgi:putative MFS transporter